MKETMKKLTQGATRLLVLTLGLGLASTGWAEAITKANPVTGGTESYDNVFSSGSEWNTAENWTLKETDKVPFISGGNYNPALVTNATVSTSTAIDGWTLRVGAYDGASVTWSGGITKIQAGSAGCWLTADETSSITIASFAGNQLEGSDSLPFKLSSANASGITWSAGLTSASNTTLPFWYYLKGDGTVVYNGDITIANAQVIKQADITLSGTSRVTYKTLVSFGSGTTKAFTADATIKRLNSSGEDSKNDTYLATVTSGSTTLTGSEAVGTCELVQTSTGILLYWVDGDSLDMPAYKRSININFTDGNGLTTTSDVGLSGYAVPGTSWNNFIIPNNANEQTFSSVKSIYTSGVASIESGVSVTVSGHRGSYSCSSLASASNPLHGYIDEGAEKATPTVTITGIPYDHYRVIFYHSTDTANLPFGYDTINGFNFTYVNDEQTTGTSSWGASGAADSANAIEEGVNTLVSAVLSGDTVTMVAHRIGGSTPTARGCFAAIQVVEYVPEVGENDLEIAVDGDTAYAVSEEKTLSGTVYLTGSGTLTLSGSEKITAATIDVGKDVTLNVNADRLDGTTFTGAGTVVYNKTVAPVANKGWTAIGWSGTVWVKNQSVAAFQCNQYGNSGSTVRFTGVTGYLARKTTANITHTVPLELVDDGDTAAFTYNNGWGGSVVVINKLKGTGKLKTGTAGNGEIIYIANADDFSGSFELTYKKVQIGGSEPTGNNQNWNGQLEIPSNATATISNDKTWTANGGFVVNGTLNANGTLASSHASKAVSGSGTVVFNSKLPSPTGDAWWKNSSWDGTVQLKSVAFTGSDDATKYLDVNKYGNTDSILELNNCSGWLPHGRVEGDNTCAVPLKITGTLTINDGISNKQFTINKLSGDGSVYTTSNGATVTIQVLNADGFTGKVQLNSKRVIFGETIPETFTSGQIYVGSGFSFTVPNSDVAWYGTGGITLDGELKATSLSNFGSGTTITTGENGVFTLINSNNTQDHEVDYARISGTGTLRYAEVSDKWRTLSMVNFPTNMVCENNLSAGIILQRSGAAHTIGSLAGSGQIRSDWGGSGNTGDRDLKILQARDTTYSGVFASSNDRLRDVYVAPGVSSAGTLTLSGTQTASNGLTVQSGAKVNLTGTWVGATTVAGTFGGTGTLTGNLTFSAGATFKAFSSDADGLAVSGTITYHAEGTVTVDVSGLENGSGDVALIAASGLDVDKFTLSSSSPEGASLAVKNNVLMVSMPPVSGTFSGGDCTWAEVTWDGGVAPVNNSDVAVMVSESGTLTLGTVQSPVIATKATFNVPAEKTLTLTGILVAEEITFTGSGTVVCRENNTLTGTIKGDATITIEYPEHTLPQHAIWTDDDWKGTLVLKKCGQLWNGQSGYEEVHDRVPFENYGNTNSFIKANGFRGYAAKAASQGIPYCEATLVVDEGDVFELNHGNAAIIGNTTEAGFRFKKLTGAGKILLDGTSDIAQYIFEDVSAFTGTVEITDPNPDQDVGGKKSFIFNLPEDWEVSTAFPANLVIATGEVTVPASKTWDIPAGIVLNGNSVLKLGDGSTITRLSSKSSGTLAVPSGLATLTNVMDSVVTAKLDIDSGATLNISDTSLTTLTIPADSSAENGTYSNEGILNLFGCTALTELHLTLGESKTFNFSNVTLPASCTTIYYDIGNKRDLTDYSLAETGSENLANVTDISYYATETPEEYANGGFVASNVTAGALWLIRRNGALINTTTDGTDRKYAGGSSFAGAACWHEWDFEKSDDRLGDYGRFSTNATTQTPLIPLQTISTPIESDYSTCYISVQKEYKTILSSAIHPYAAVDFPTATTGWSAALRCSMPIVTGENKAVAFAFGTPETGVLGLASTAKDFVELFQWTNGVYTTLAELKVESPSDKDNMHIYVLSVTNNTVSLYRDGEFIHTAEFALTGSIGKFMVGNVADRGEVANLPLAATDDGSTAEVNEAGYVDYVRLYDKILPEVDVAGLSLRRPFVSAIDLFERSDIDPLGGEWSATDAWTKTAGTTAAKSQADVPSANANVTVSVDASTSLDLNIADDVKYGTLIFNGTGNVGLGHTGSESGRIGAEMFVVRSGVNLTVDHDAVDFSSAIVGVDSGASLAFNFEAFPFASVTVATNIVLAGSVPDTTSTARYSVVLPASLPAQIVSAEPAWDNGSYKLAITLDHTPGTDVYYAGGYWSSTEDSFSVTNASGDATAVLPGDTVVIPADISGGNATSAYFGSPLPANVTKIRVEKDYTFEPGIETAILNGVTVDVANGCTLSFGATWHELNLGAVTLNGAACFTANASAESLAGTATIAVDSNKKLTLGSITTFVSGGVAGAGTVKLPASLFGSVNFNAYGNAYSTVEVTGLTAGELADGTCNPTLLVSGAAAFTTVGTYTFTKITGSGNLSLPSGSIVTIGELADYDGTVTSAGSVTVSKLVKTGIFVGGDLLLTKGEGSTVTVSAVEVNGVAKYGVWDGNNFYLASAKYNDQYYRTVALAITAAGDNIGDIIVYDTTAALDDQYMYVAENDVTKIAQKPFALVVSGTHTYYGDAGSVVGAAQTAGEYNYIEVRVGGEFDIPLDILSSLMIKNTLSATLNFTGFADDYMASASEPAENVITYTKTAKATTYTWTGGAIESETGKWTALNNWSFVNNSSQTVTASRYPQAGDTVVFAAGATVTLEAAVTIAAVNVGAVVTFSAESELTLAATSIVLTDAGATITVTNVTLSSEPTTTVPYSRVDHSGSTYSVVTDAPITDVTFDYYVGYTNANVRATVGGAGTYTLTVGTHNYQQTADAAGVITFENVDVTGVSTEAGVAYTITASAGASGSTHGTSPKQSSGTVTDTGWMAWSDGGSKVGSWDPVAGPSYSEGVAAFSGTNTYSAAWVSTGEVVTVTTTVQFGDVADESIAIDADAQAAIRIGTDNVFQVYAGPTPAWVNVYNDELGAPEGDTQYGVSVKLDYTKQTYGVDITKEATTYSLTTATDVASFPLAKNASAMQKVSYLGAGSFISLSGEYVSAGYTADIGTGGSATNVVVSSDFVNHYLSGIKASEVAAALSPSATGDQYKGKNGYNFFTCYALGLDPTVEEDKPEVRVETTVDGQFVVTLVDGNGDPIVGAANVALTLKFQKGDDPNHLTTETTSSFQNGSATIDPTGMTGNVQYYKVQVDIGAK